MEPYFVSSFYRFTPIEPDVLTLTSESLYSLAEPLRVKGLVVLSPEGVNATVSGGKEEIKSFIEKLKETVNLDGTIFKESVSQIDPFRRFKVDIRPEIITYYTSTRTPDNSVTFLSPAEWHSVLTTEKDFVLLDTRNWYEVKVGKFREAIDPKIDTFTDLPKAVERLGIPKDKKVLVYCTGGVRCEKAAEELLLLGYEAVHQLRGGILKYMEEFPSGEFEGECFVFDHRVALDSELKPSKRFTLCPLCGDPGDIKVNCALCSKDAVICDKCSEKYPKPACSKNCRHHIERNR